MPSEHSIRNSHSQLLNMLDSIAAGIYCVDLTGDCTYCNARCVELLGYDNEDEMLGKNMHDLIHYRHRDGSEYKIEDCRIFLACHAGQNVHVDNEVFWRKDKRRIDVEYWSFPIREGGLAVGAVVSFADISLRRAESAHKTQLARLVETSLDAIIGKNIEGVITSWNQGATQIYGYDAEEAIGQTASLILPPERSAEEPEIRQALLDGVDLRQFEVKRQRKNGEICDVSITISPLFNADDDLIGCSSIERDITDSRRSRDAILRAKTSAEHAETMAKQASKSRTEFLANVSHELRTPMNAILGMLNLSLEENLDPLVCDYLNVAKTSADSLLNLVNELLDFAKIESGKFEISNESFDLREAVDTPAKVLASRASEKGLEILCEIDGEIPMKLIGDGRRIQQVVTNLLSNAVKFTTRGEIVVKVNLVKKLPSEVRLRFAVVDTGVGISAKDQESILLPFQQADMSSTRTHHGTGLGLSICRELVALMGGGLKLESELGKGSRFYFDLSLPVDDDAKPADQVPTELVEDLRVLIVDDNPTNLRILEKIFVSWSMQPIVSESAEQAIRILDDEKANDHAISLAIVDAMMPNVDGFALADRIEQRREHGPPIVMMQSAADLGLFTDRTSDAAVAHYLTKPVSQSELLNAVVDTLDLYSHPAFPMGQNRSNGRLKSPIQSLSILLVEDLPANQKVAQAILKKRGHKVVTASNGRVAVDLVQSEGSKFDVILMDIQMPVMDGMQATDAIRNLADKSVADLPIVAMTAHAMQGDREACLAAGMDAYISKPLDAKRLIELTESIVLDPNVNRELDLQPLSGSKNGGSKNGDAKNESSKTNRSNAAEDGGSDRPYTVEGNLVEYEASLKRLGNDRDLFIEFIEIFMNDSPKMMEDIGLAVELDDCAKLERAAHALKGLMSNFGAKPCCQCAQDFETAGRNQDVKAVAAKMPTLKDWYLKLCSELNEFIDAK
jgi:PAS domain S-box-containing protein